jgi:hypothetical protein
MLSRRKYRQLSLPSRKAGPVAFHGLMAFVTALLLTVQGKLCPEAVQELSMPGRKAGPVASRGQMAFVTALLLTVSGEGAGLTAGPMVMHHLDGL